MRSWYSFERLVNIFPVHIQLATYAFNHFFDEFSMDKIISYDITSPKPRQKSQHQIRSPVIKPLYKRLEYYFYITKFWKEPYSSKLKKKHSN